MLQSKYWKCYTWFLKLTTQRLVKNEITLSQRPITLCVRYIARPVHGHSTYCWLELKTCACFAREIKTAACINWWMKRDYGNLYPNVSCRQALQLTIHTQPAFLPTCYSHLLLGQYPQNSITQPWFISMKCHIWTLKDKPGAALGLNHLYRCWS